MRLVVFRVQRHHDPVLLPDRRPQVRNFSLITPLPPPLLSGGVYGVVVVHVVAVAAEIKVVAVVVIVIVVVVPVVVVAVGVVDQVRGDGDGGQYEV